MEHRSGYASTRSNTVATLLWGWFAAGAMLLALFPPLRQHDQVWGWLPFWCVVAPLIDLAFVHRARLRTVGHAMGLSMRQHFRRARHQAVVVPGRGSRWGNRRGGRRRLDRDSNNCRS